MHNAKIYSVDENFSTYQAMAVKDGKILELGAERQILNKYKSKRSIDARTRPVFPGFYDAHSHFMGYAINEVELNLFETSSIDQIVELIKDFANKSERNWIVGRGWDQNDWDEKNYPNKSILDSLFPNRPVYLNRVDGHAAWVNQRALDITGIDENFKINGGKVLIGKTGKPSGILIDEAATFVNNQIPSISPDLERKLLLQAEKRCFEAGLTTVTDAGLPASKILFLDSLKKQEI